jgi:hypothetical protein
VKIIHGTPALAFLSALAAAGCDDAGHAPSSAADAGADLSPDGPAAPADAATDAGPGAGGLVWATSAPPVEGDGRLVDVEDGERGFGWDTCFASPPVSLSPQGTPPPATRGNAYLLSSPSPAPNASSAAHVAQAYVWLERPGSALGLWFDLALVSGSGEGATISFYETDKACAAKRSFGTFGVATALTSTGQWKTGCLDVSGKGDLEAIGVRIEAPSGVLGFDALRFDRACE